MHLQFAISLIAIARLVASDPQNQNPVFLGKPETCVGTQEHDNKYSMVIKADEFVVFCSLIYIR
jgi:hypothetical protein